MSEQTDTVPGMRRFALFAFAIRVGAAGLAFLTQIVLARIIGEEEYGRVATAMTVLLLVASFATLGLDAVAQRFIPAYRIADARTDLRHFLRMAARVALVLGCLVAAAGAFVLARHDPLIALTLAGTPLLALLIVQEGIAKSFDWPVLALAPNYILRPLILLAIVVAAAAAGWSVGAEVVIVATLAAAFVALMIQGVFLARRLPDLVPRRRRRNEPRETASAGAGLRGWIAVSAPVLVGDLGALVMTSADVIALAYFVGSAEAGIYFAAIKSLALVQFVSYAIANASAHRIAALAARGEREAMRRFVARACWWTFLPSLGLTLAVIAAGPFILGLFGPGFAEGYPALVIAALGYLALSAVGPAERVLNMIGAERACAVVYVATAVIAVMLVVALVPAFGMIGAASALAAALCVEAAALAVLLRLRLSRADPPASDAASLRLAPKG